MTDLPKRRLHLSEPAEQSNDFESEAARIKDAVLTSMDDDPIGSSTVQTGEEQQAETEAVDKEIFYTTLFRPAFTGIALATRVEAAKIDKSEEGAAREASDDLYDLLEVWYPAALDPKTGTFKRLCTVGGFLFFKIQVIRAAIIERRTQIAEPSEQPQPQASHNTAQQSDWGGGGLPA